MSFWSEIDRVLKESVGSTPSIGASACVGSSLGLDNEASVRTSGRFCKYLRDVSRERNVQNSRKSARDR